MLTFWPVTFEVFVIVKLTYGFTVTFDSFEGTLVVFSVEFATATFVNVPFVLARTCIQTEVEFPPASSAIVQTNLFEVTLSGLSEAATNSNSVINSSVILTLVAFVGPLFVTVIVKLIRPPTTVTFTSEVLITVRLTRLVALTEVLFSVPVVFSVEFTETMFSMVPFPKTRTTNSII